MFYEQVKGLCARDHVAISAMSRKLNLSPSAPLKWKEGVLPKTETVMKIAEYFNVTTDYLLYGQNARTTSNSTGDNSQSVVLQGVNGNGFSVANSTGGGGLSDMDAELLRVFKGLNLKGQTAVLSCAYAQEEKQSK